MSPRPLSNRQQGFTLIEIIITFTVAAVMMAMIIPYMNTRQTDSKSPAVRFKTTLATYQAMENISADYEARKLLGTEGSSLLANLKTGIGAAGTSQDNSYGQYKVIANDYIQFTVTDTTNRAEASATATTANNALKVTISDPGSTGVVLTTLFTN